MMQRFPGERWTRLSVGRIEDLGDAVLGAGLQAVQMSTGPLAGSLAFLESDGLLFSSGLIDGQVALNGPLSQDRVTLGIGLHIAPGSRHWLEEVQSGVTGVFLAGDEHDAMYRPGSLYASLTLSFTRLESEAARLGRVLNRQMLGGTGIHRRPIAAPVLGHLRRSFGQAHEAGTGHAGSLFLEAVIEHYSRPPLTLNRLGIRTGLSRTLRRARSYIHEHLAEPLHLKDIAAHAGTSPRTVQRAFALLLDDTPVHYVRRLRLHRIRRDLVGARERGTSIALVAQLHGISETGRMAGWYRELFSELPRETAARGAT